MEIIGSNSEQVAPSPGRPNADSYGRLDVSIREASYVAGKISPVAILVRNPFDVPVEILEIQGPRSSHLSEIGRMGTNQDVVYADSKNATPHKTGLLSWIKNHFLGQVSVVSLSLGGIRATFPTEDNTIQVNAKGESRVEIPADSIAGRLVQVKTEENAQVVITADDHISRKDSNDTYKPFVLQPHCDAVAHFYVSTGNWLLCIPTRQALSTQIRYRINGKEKTQVIHADFEVKPPLLSMVIGAIIGATLGSSAKALNAPTSPSFASMAVSIGSSVVMSMIAAIALSRKTGTQGFITVEDFYGGFVVGALIGYGGSSYFESAIKPETRKASAEGN